MHYFIYLFSELELQLHTLDGNHENQSPSEVPKVKELEKAIRMIKQEKDEAVKVSCFLMILTVMFILNKFEPFLLTFLAIFMIYPIKSILKRES